MSTAPDVAEVAGRLTMLEMPDAARLNMLLHGMAMMRYEINQVTGIVEAQHVPVNDFRMTAAEYEAKAAAYKARHLQE